MIHQYRLGGYNSVLDVCSGAVHVVDDAAYDVIALFETQGREEIVARLLEKYRNDPEVTEAELNECYDQVVRLRDEGRLFTPDTFAPMAGELKRRASGVVKACACTWPTPAT